MPIEAGQQALASDVLTLVNTTHGEGAKHRWTDGKLRKGAGAAADPTEIDPYAHPSAIQCTTGRFGKTRLQWANDKFLKGTGATTDPVEVDIPTGITSAGSYTGTSTVNRAITHGLGVAPKLVLIYDYTDSVHWYRIMSGLAAIVFAVLYQTSTETSVKAVTAMDATNFYVGNATH